MVGLVQNIDQLREAARQSSGLQMTMLTHPMLQQGTRQEKRAAEAELYEAIAGRLALELSVQGVLLEKYLGSGMTADVFAMSIGTHEDMQRMQIDVKTPAVAKIRFIPQGVEQNELITLENAAPLMLGVVGHIDYQIQTDRQGSPVRVVVGAEGGLPDGSAPLEAQAVHTLQVRLEVMIRANSLPLESRIPEHHTRLMTANADDTVANEQLRSVFYTLAAYQLIGRDQQLQDVEFEQFMTLASHGRVIQWSDGTPAAFIVDAGVVNPEGAWRGMAAEPSEQYPSVTMPWEQWKQLLPKADVEQVNVPDMPNVLLVDVLRHNPGWTPTLPESMQGVTFAGRHITRGQFPIVCEALQFVTPNKAHEVQAAMQEAQQQLRGEIASTRQKEYARNVDIPDTCLIDTAFRGNADGRERG